MPTNIGFCRQCKKWIVVGETTNKFVKYCKQCGRKYHNKEEICDHCRPLSFLTKKQIVWANFQDQLDNHDLEWHNGKSDWNIFPLKKLREVLGVQNIKHDLRTIALILKNPPKADKKFLQWKYKTFEPLFHKNYRELLVG